MRIAVAASLLACLGCQGLWAQAAPQKLTVHRSTRAIPHKFIVHPSEATIAVNQTQHFEVTDAQGRSVAVHWNVSGIGCSGLGCGSIDDQGFYRTPTSLPQPRVVTVEGVLVSDPNYSVLTEVRLEDSIAATASVTPGRVAAGKTEPFPVPEVGRPDLAKNAGLPPVPYAVAAAPVVGRRTLATSSGLPPLPNAVAAAPAVGRQLAISAELMPIPNPVGVAPVVGRRNLAVNAASPPLPTVVAAAPGVGKQVARSAGSPPLPTVIAPAPAIERQRFASSVELMPIPIVVAAAPGLGKQVARSAGSPPLPTVIAAAPVVGRQNLASSSGLPPLPDVVAAAPVVGRQTLASSSGFPPLPNLVAVVSPTPQIFTVKTQPLTAAAVGRQNVAGRGVLAPMPDAVATAPVASVVSTQHGPMVTYRDGQLTIDAENLTLAAVLKLVAEKTGAVIEVPPGSGLERIVEHTGPAPANDVLERLLNGSAFNFIIVSSPQHPNQPAQVLLSLHGPDTDTPTVASIQPKAAPSWTEPAPPAAVVPYALDGRNFQLPKEPLTPEAMSELMRERGRQLREALTKPQ